MSNLFVVGMGVGTVFVGLICIVFLCIIMSAICKAFTKKPQQQTSSFVPAPVETQPEQNHQEIIAALSAAIAEDMGTDIQAIRILSFKKL